MTALVVIFGVLLVGVALVIWGTHERNRWGINLEAVSCPRCNTPLPKARTPQSIGKSRGVAAHARRAELKLTSGGVKSCSDNRALTGYHSFLLTGPEAEPDEVPEGKENN